MIDPILINIGPISIRWYSIAYILGILLGFAYINFLDKKAYRILTKEIEEKLMLYVISGIIIGGRLGYVIFYNLDYYLANIKDIFQTWKGGMSFHGGTIGLTIAIFIFCKKKDLSFLKMMDLISSAAPIGIFFGRLANFINGELYGRPTNLKWGIKFLPHEIIRRHPTQIYEALTEGLLTFIILYISFIHFKLYKIPGKISGVFLICYGFFRIVIENFREPDWFLGFFWSYLTMGQILSFPMLSLGISLLFIKPIK